jgi:hypothetical protein
VVNRTQAAEEAGPDDVQLQLTVERLLGEALGGQARVSGLTRRACPFAGVYPADVLTVRLAGGRQIALFVKHLGPEQSDQPDKQRRDREVRVYEELLGEGGLPVPRYYGTRWNEATGRHEVFLEHVADWDLRYQGLEHWFTAARQLAHLHARFAAPAGELLACDFLLRLDAPYFRAWAGRALAVLASLSAGLAADFEGALGNYGRVTDLLARQPLTLVHNDLAPKNVLADRSQDPTRICVVDWEMAGVGCGLLDLVHLKCGLDPASDREMRGAYCAELAGTGLLPEGPRELDRLFAACELHRTVYRLAFCNEWRVPPEKVARWVSEARGLAEQVGGATGRVGGRAS